MLCRELRRRLINTLSETGGHLASNLGVVELTVALCSVFDMPSDALVWDVGHQCYSYKMLTGRLDGFAKLRHEGGVSGFPRSGESGYDSFIGGHASTSISAAFGIAKAKTLTGDSHHAIAVVGDGAFTGGLIYEGLNNAGRSSDRIVVVLNDNDMSISKSVGSLARYLAAKRASKGYLNAKIKVENTLGRVPVVGERLKDAFTDSKAAFRQLIYHSNLFEDFGFDYLGPVDGHDIELLEQTLKRARDLNKPVVVHVNTVKGKGYEFAEKNPSQFHGVGGFDMDSGEMTPPSESFSSVFGEHLLELARVDKKLCAITAAMETGTGLAPFAEEFEPQNRFFDVGIAEEHAVTFACGLAAGGMTPVFAVYSTFLQRGFDQLIHDASIEPRHIVLAVDRAGMVGSDGETHQGLFDAAFLSAIPNSTVYSPSTFAELEWSMDEAIYKSEGLCVVRYPRGTQAKLDENYTPADFCHVKNGGEVLIISYGREFGEAYKAAAQLSDAGNAVDLLKLTKIFPIPDEAIQIARRYRAVFFAEEGVRGGGIGEHFLSALTDGQYLGRMLIHAVDDPFIPPMEIPRAIERCGLDAASLARLVTERCFR